MPPLNCNVSKLFLPVFILLILFPYQSLTGRTIAFFYALDADLAVLKNHSIPARTLQVGDRKISEIRSGGNTIFAVKMSSGAVETAVSAQALFSRQRIDLAFSSGPAGVLSPEIELNKWYAIHSCVAYQSGSHTSSGYVPGKKKLSFKIPETLTLPVASLASGELFIASSSKKEEIFTLTQADLIDMNTFGLLAACRSHQVPLFCIRVASDLADDTAQNTFSSFVAGYNGHGGKLFLEWVDSLKPDPTDPNNHSNLKKIIQGQ